MTWGELKAISLQKMYAVEGPSVGSTRDTEPYLDQLYAPANEALMLVATAARPLLRVVAIAQEGPEGEGAARVYELADLAERFFKLAEGLVYEERRGAQVRTADYLLEAPGRLLLPNRAGRWRVTCLCYPREITPDTGDATVLEVDPDAAVLLPLYVASQLFKDDEPTVAAQLRNEFELGLQRLAATAPTPQGGLHFVSARGWH